MSSYLPWFYKMIFNLLNQANHISRCLFYNIYMSFLFFQVKKLGEATMYLAKEAAPHIRREGSRLLPKSLKQSKEGEGKSTVDSVIEVAASGLHGKNFI